MFTLASLARYAPEGPPSPFFCFLLCCWWEPLFSIVSWIETRKPSIMRPSIFSPAPLKSGSTASA